MSEAARPIAALFRHCWTAARPARWRWLGLGLVVTSHLLDGAMVWLCGLLLDLVLVPYSFGSFGPLLVAYVLLVSAKGLIAFGEMAFGERIVGGPWRSLRQRLLGGTPLPGSDSVPAWRTGRATSQLATDMVAIERLLPTGLLDTGASALRGVIFLTILALLHWQLALITLLVVGGCPRLIARIGPKVTSTNFLSARGHARDFVGPLLLALLGLLLTLQGRLSPGGLLLTLAAVVQIALLLHRVTGTVRLLDAAVPAATRIVALLHNQPIAPVATTRPLRAVAAGPAHSEPLLLVGVPLALLLAFLLGGIVQASDIRPTLLFPGLRISRLAPALAAAQGGDPAGSGSPPIVASPNRPIWSATVGPRYPTPTVAATLPAAATATTGAVVAEATPTATSSAAQPTATAEPTPSPPAPAPPPTIAVAAAPDESPAVSPSPTAAPPPPPTAAPPLPVTLPPTATVPPRPIPTIAAPPTPLPAPKPSPTASASGNGPAGASQSPAPQASGGPQPSPSPSENDDNKGKPSASPSASASPSDDNGGDKGKPSASPSASPAQSPTASPSAAPSSGGNGGGGGSGPSSPNPSPSPSAVPSPSAGASPSPDNHGGGPSSPNPSPSAPAPQPSPTPKPSGKESDAPSPEPTKTPKSSRSP